MRVIVKLLYQRGIRKSDRDIQSDTGHAGMLSCAMVGTRRRLNLTGVTDSRMAPLLPELYDPEILSITHGKMLYRGVAADMLSDSDNGPRLEQLWAISVVDASGAPDT